MTEQLVNNFSENTIAQASSTPPTKNENYQQLSCLHISKTSLSKQATKYLSEINVGVTECTEIKKAQEICSGKILGIILLEGEVDQDFIKNLKTKGSCNEQTPVIYISHEGLKEDVQCLMKEQFIDDVLFECSTMEDDLIKAVKRLISEPLQFAVTPKSKRGEGNTPKRQRLDKTPMSARRCIANEFTSTENTDQNSMGRLPPSTNTYINMDATSTQTVSASEGLTYQRIAPVMSYGYNQQYMPYYQYNQYHPGNLQDYQHLQQSSAAKGNTSMEVLTAAAEMSQALLSIQPQINTQENQSSDNAACNNTADQLPQQQKLPSIEAFSHPTPAQAPTVTPTNANQMRIALQNAEKAINSSIQEMLSDDMLPKITLSGARQLLDSALLGVQQKSSSPRKEQKNEKITTRSAKKGNRSTPSGDNSVEKEPTRSSQRGRRSYTFKEVKTPTDKDSTELTPMSTGDKKEIHLAKERQRRERIARCWYQLRKLIPQCDPTADKASVFEMTVAYIYHCYKYHPNKLLTINKDFARLCDKTGPPENLDEIDKLVDEILVKEEQ